MKEWLERLTDAQRAKFAELKDGRCVDITRYGVFDKQIER